MIFYVPMNQQMYLTQYGMMAERHWREFCPAMVKELEAKGTAAYFEELVPRIVGAEHRSDDRVLTGMRAAVGSASKAVKRRMTS